MQPIVNGLQEVYEPRVAFVSFNAQDDANGEAYFQAFGLPGHPSFVLYSADGHEVYRAVGLIEEEQLRQQIEAALVDG